MWSEYYNKDYNMATTKEVTSSPRRRRSILDLSTFRGSIRHSRTTSTEEQEQCTNTGTVSRKSLKRVLLATGRAVKNILPLSSSKQDQMNQSILESDTVPPPNSINDSDHRPQRWSRRRSLRDLIGTSKSRRHSKNPLVEIYPGMETLDNKSYGDGTHSLPRSQQAVVDRNEVQWSSLKSTDEYGDTSTPGMECYSEGVSENIDCDHAAREMTPLGVSPGIGTRACRHEDLRGLQQSIDELHGQNLTPTQLSQVSLSQTMDVRNQDPPEYGSKTPDSYLQMLVKSCLQSNNHSSSQSKLDQASQFSSQAHSNDAKGILLARNESGDMNTYCQPCRSHDNLLLDASQTTVRYESEGHADEYTPDTYPIANMIVNEVASIKSSDDNNMHVRQNDGDVVLPQNPISDESDTCFSFASQMIRPLSTSISRVNLFDCENIMNTAAFSTFETDITTVGKARADQDAIRTKRFEIFLPNVPKKALTELDECDVETSDPSYDKYLNSPCLQVADHATFPLYQGKDTLSSFFRQDFASPRVASAPFGSVSVHFPETSTGPGHIEFYETISEAIVAIQKLNQGEYDACCKFDHLIRVIFLFARGTFTSNIKDDLAAGLETLYLPVGTTTAYTLRHGYMILLQGDDKLRTRETYPLKQSCKGNREQDFGKHVHQTECFDISFSTADDDEVLSQNSSEGATGKEELSWEDASAFDADFVLELDRQSSHGSTTSRSLSRLTYDQAPTQGLSHFRSTAAAEEVTKCARPQDTGTIHNAEDVPDPVDWSNSDTSRQLLVESDNTFLRSAIRDCLVTNNSTIPRGVRLADDAALDKEVVLECKPKSASTEKELSIVNESRLVQPYFAAPLTEYSRPPSSQRNISPASSISLASGFRFTQYIDELSQIAQNGSRHSTQLYDTFPARSLDIFATSQSEKNCPQAKEKGQHESQRGNENDRAKGESPTYGNIKPGALVDVFQSHGLMPQISPNIRGPAGWRSPFQSAGSRSPSPKAHAGTFINSSPHLFIGTKL